MQRAKSFFLVCAGILMLSIAYQLGASNANAQGPGNPVVTGTGGVVVTANGDVYSIPGSAQAVSQWVLAGNVFGAQPTTTHSESWGSVKQRYR